MKTLCTTCVKTLGGKDHQSSSACPKAAFHTADGLQGGNPVHQDSGWHREEKVVAAELEGACAQA